MLNRLTDSLDFQAQALNLRSERQRLLASNIANADTPGYVAREMNFAQVLRNATGTAGGPQAPAAPLAATAPGHIGGNGGNGGSGASNGYTVSTLDYAMPSQTNLDRNTVDMDRERASFADNTVKYEATLRFLGAQVKTTMQAITGQ
ncbi:MAG TPA: flagellar basal body rod protein FlgB [Burkholderiaceae bacterium]|jgi:flagellar basal-body rod protein FlgB